MEPEESEGEYEGESKGGEESEREEEPEGEEEPEREEIAPLVCQSTTSLGLGQV